MNARNYNGRDDSECIAIGAARPASLGEPMTAFCCRHLAATLAHNGFRNEQKHVEHCMGNVSEEEWKTFVERARARYSEAQ